MNTNRHEHCVSVNEHRLALKDFLFPFELCPSLFLSLGRGE